MNLTQLDYVLALNRTRNFIQAAKECNISQPTLSMQIRKLEDDLGYPLFDRSMMPILPTAEGQLFIKQALIVSHEFKKLFVIGNDKIIKGELKIGIIPTISPYLTPMFLHDFATTYPQVKISIEEMTTKRILEALSLDLLDAGILATPLRDSRLVERVLYYESFQLYFSPNHPLLKRKEIDSEDLNFNQLWLLDDGHCLRNQIIKICGMNNKNRNIEYHGGNLEVLTKLVDHGEGFTVVPDLATKNLDKSKLRNFKIKNIKREVSLVTMRSFYKDKLIEALEKGILDSLPSELVSPKKANYKIINP